MIIKTWEFDDIIVMDKTINKWMKDNPTYKVIHMARTSEHFSEKYTYYGTSIMYDENVFTNNDKL